MINITPLAKEKINHTLAQAGMEEYYLRLGLAGASCSNKFIVGLDKHGSLDETWIIEGIRVIIDKKHLMYLAGRQLDYRTEDGESYFAII